MKTMNPLEENPINMTKLRALTAGCMVQTAKSSLGTNVLLNIQRNAANPK